MGKPIQEATVALAAGTLVGCSTAFRSAISGVPAFGVLASALVGLLCTFGGASAVQAVFGAITEIPCQGIDPRACYQASIFGGSFKKVDDSNCQGRR